MLRHYSLIPLFAAFILLQINLALFHSSDPQILSFATSIYQQDFFSLVNQERIATDLPVLVESPRLDHAAQLKAQDMFAKDYWAHVAPDGTTPWDFFQAVNYNYTYAGENLAKDFNTSAGVVSGWMASASHRSNILNPNFKEVGIAVVNGVLLGEETTLVVQLFGTSATLAQQSTPPVVASTQTQQVPTPPATAPTEVAAEVTQETPSPEPQLHPYSIIATAGSDQNHKPPGISARLRAGLNNLQAKATVAVNPHSWSVGQQITIIFFLGLMTVLVGDSITLWRKGIKRRNSHSMMHAGMLGILIVLTMISSLGAIL